MRRRISIVIAGLALLLGASSVVAPTNATLLCPPGCLVAGVISGSGGFPDPTTLQVGGTVTIVASTRTGSTVADVATVGETYHLSLSGTVTAGANGTVTGSALFHASRFEGGSYQSFGGTVQVSGTRTAIRLTGSGLESQLAFVAGTVSGTVVVAG